MENFLKFGEELMVEEYPLFDSGNYEVTIVSIEKKVTEKEQKPYLRLTFQARTDVEQAFKGGKIGYSIFKKDGDKCYDYNKINGLVITQPDYKEQKFGSFDEVIQYLMNKDLIIGIEQYHDDEKDQMRCMVKRVDKDHNAKPSETPRKAETPAGDSVTLPEEDGDFPF